MLEKITKKTHPIEWALILKALPSYRKRSAFLSIQDTVSLSGRYWDGGSRTVWHIINGNSVEQVPSRNDFPFIAPDIEVDLNNFELPGVLITVVSSGTFCGKPSFAHVYISPKGYCNTSCKDLSCSNCEALKNYSKNLN